MNESSVAADSDVVATGPPSYYYYTIMELDIAIGIIYLFFGMFGIYSNGSVLWQFWTVRKTIKVHPFTLCALVLAGSDLLLCTLGVSPYAILILAGRPTPTSFPPFLCKIFGFVNNFSDRFAWFDITSIMVFRCITMAFPLKLRGVTYKPFIYILSFLALLQGIICMLPFFDLDSIYDRYVYNPNMGECSYGVNGTMVPGMVVLIDLLWWGPFIACVVSCILFFIFMAVHANKFTSVGKSDKGSDAKKKTALLTSFFIICYFPKALLTLFDFLINTNRWISWDWFLGALGDPLKSLRLYVYLNLMCKSVIPAGRAAFTPTMLRLQSYIRRCDTSKRRKSTEEQSRIAASFQTGVSAIKNKLFKTGSRGLLKGHSDKDNGMKTGLKEEHSQLV